MTAPIKIDNRLKQFCVLPVSLIRDTAVSDRARFLFCWMASMPRDWEFYLGPMTRELGYSEDTIRKYMQELVAGGWVIRGGQNNNGRFGSVAYTLNEAKLPSPEDTESEKTRLGKNQAQPNIDNKPNTEDKPNKEKSAYDSFIEPEYAEAFLKFLQYRCDIRRPFKPVSIKPAYENLKKLADYNPAVAREIVEQTIANQWQGLFKLKNKGNATEKNVRRNIKDVRRFTEEDSMSDDI